MEVNELISRLGAEIGLKDLALNEEHMARLQFDNRLIVDLEYEQETQCLYLCAVLGEIPEEKRKEVFEQLLIGNLFCRQTRGAVLAVSPMDQEILLVRSFPTAKSDYRDFTDALENFVAAVDDWTDRLAAEDGASSSESAENAASLEEKVNASRSLA
jgi:hypothetical protein